MREGEEEGKVLEEGQKELRGEEVDSPMEFSKVSSFRLSNSQHLS